jgi:hypothetical protein
MPLKNRILNIKIGKYKKLQLGTASKFDDQEEDTCR